MPTVNALLPYLMVWIGFIYYIYYELWAKIFKEYLLPTVSRLCKKLYFHGTALLPYPVYTFDNIYYKLSMKTFIEYLIPTVRCLDSVRGTDLVL